jgi:hypothetical protein
VGSANYERSGPECVGDPHANLISADARVNDLAQRLVAVLRSNRRQRSDMTDRPRLDARPMIIVVRRGRAVRDARDEPDRRCGGEDAQSALNVCNINTPEGKEAFLMADLLVGTIRRR